MLTHRSSPCLAANPYRNGKSWDFYDPSIRSANLTGGSYDDTIPLSDESGLGTDTAVVFSNAFAILNGITFV